MIFLLISMKSFIVSMMFNSAKHPLWMMMLLLIQTIMVSLIIGLMSKSFWFSYILFLIFIGGMLILFMYMISFISNEKFYFSLNIMGIIFITIIIILLINKDLLLINKMIFNMDLTLMSNNYLLVKENTINIMKFYNYPTNLINLMLMNYLFLMLIITVKITKSYYGPIRIFN